MKNPNNLNNSTKTPPNSQENIVKTPQTSPKNDAITQKTKPIQNETTPKYPLINQDPTETPHKNPTITTKNFQKVSNSTQTTNQNSATTLIITQDTPQTVAIAPKNSENNLKTHQTTPKPHSTPYKTQKYTQKSTKNSQFSQKTPQNISKTLKKLSKTSKPPFSFPSLKENREVSVTKKEMDWKFSKKFKITLGIFLFLIIVMAVCAFFTPSHISPTGGFLEKPTFTHPLGTDDLGVDNLARLSHGFFASLEIGAYAGILSFLLGGLFGIFLGYFDNFLSKFMRVLTDAVLTLPTLPLIIVFSTFLGSSKLNLIIIIVILSFAKISKIVEAKTREIKSRKYFQMSKFYGATFPHLLKTHILKDIMAILIISSISQMGNAILQEASLSFLGLSDPTRATLGLIINRCTSFPGIYFTTHWIFWMVPPMIILTLSLTLLKLMSKELETLWH